MTSPQTESVRWAWPPGLDGGVRGQAVCAFPIEVDSTVYGTLVVARLGAVLLPSELVGLVRDLCRRVGLALHTARQYTKIEQISSLLQRSLKPLTQCRVPGIECSVVYEPVGEGVEAGGDFYDVFESGPQRWSFVLGDVCGAGPEAAAATALARHAVRLFAREGCGPAEVLERLNRAIVAEGDDGRLTSLVHGQLSTLPDGGSRCEICCAGHVLPLVLDPSGRIDSPLSPQLLLGVLDEPGYFTESIALAPGQSLICVTDGVTEHRREGRLLDDDDGLVRMLSGCRRRTAAGIAEYIRLALAEFSAAPKQDDGSILVMTATGVATTTASAAATDAGAGAGSATQAELAGPHRPGR
ncbi:MAG TPA: PP2C family protein-serine/threonine phosphatase [Actinocrinis sp.]|jgi:serine phosphatase RsbU (regulator of sigma subunit)